LALHKALHYPPQSSIGGGGGGLLSSLVYRPTFDNEGNNNSSSSKWSGILQKRRNKAKIDLLQNELEQQDRQEQILKHSNDNNDNNNIIKSASKPPILSNQKRIKLLQQQELQNQNTLSSIYRRTVILLDVKTTDLNDITSTVEYLRDAISFLLRIYYDSKSNVKLDLGTQLEIVFCVESPGGVVQDFGLAADQIKRLKMARSVRRSTTSNTKHTNTVEKGVEEEEEKDRNDLVVTICVDKIAASGGYMIASQADQGQLLCAPFAVIGSIGVLRETINVYDVLDKYGVKPLLLKAGTAKAPLSSTTKITEESVALVQRNLDKVHDAFQRMVLESRGSVIDASNVAEVMNGDIFLGQDAHGLGLVDRVMTSDEYIDERICAGDRVLRLHKYDKLRHGIKFSPLDLLLMNQNGLLSKIGRKVPIQVLVNMISKSVPFLKFLGAIGFMKVMDSRYKFPFASIEAYNSKSWQ
jgi:serine protease SohB